MSPSSTLRRLALLLPLLCLLAALGGHAAQKSCRRCGCTVQLSGVINPSGIDNFMRHACGTFTGGDFYTWNTYPTPDNKYYGAATFHRMCGNGGTFTKSWDFKYYNQGNTTVALGCACDNSVVCNGGSKCEKSGL